MCACGGCLHAISRHFAGDLLKIITQISCLKKVEQAAFKRFRGFSVTFFTLHRDGKFRSQITLKNGIYANIYEAVNTVGEMKSTLKIRKIRKNVGYTVLNTEKKKIKQVEGHQTW